MKNLEPHRLYINKGMKVWFFTNGKGKLIGSYMHREAAQEGLRICIEDEEEKEEE